MKFCIKWHAYGGENVKKELGILIIAFVVSMSFIGAVAAQPGYGPGHKGVYGINHGYGQWHGGHGSWWWRYHYRPWWRHHYYPRWRHHYNPWQWHHYPWRR